MTTPQEAMRNNFEAVFIAAIRNSKPGTLKDIARLCYEAALAQQGKPCDMGQMCLNCQPRGPNGECPDQSANQAPASSASSKMIAQQPPVAWMNLKAKVPMFRSKKPSEDEGTIVEHWQPLYTAAPAPQPAQEQVGINGLTEAETGATMSVLGLSKPAQEATTGCACRWDTNDNRVATCVRHQGWLDVVSEWADRAKAAEAALQSARPAVANIQTKIVKDISAHEGGKQQLPPFQPCTAGAMCLDCQPRGASDECPDATAWTDGKGYATTSKTIAEHHAANGEQMMELVARGCAYCNHPMYLGRACKNCGRDVARR